MALLAVGTDLECMIAGGRLGSDKHIRGDQFREFEHCIDCSDSGISCQLIPETW